MVKIRIGATVDPMEKLLMQLVEDWDELERWAVRNHNQQSAEFAAAEKDKLLARINAIHNEQEG